jgi:hypothetical protein
MNIVPDLALAFETKKRSPFKIVFETVKISELRCFQDEQKTKPGEQEVEEGGAEDDAKRLEAQLE